MRVLIASEYYPYPSIGGLARHSITLANQLLRSGHSVDFLGNREFTDEQGSLQCRLVPEIRLIRRTLSRTERYLGLFNAFHRMRFAREIASTIAKIGNRYDVVHYHGHCPSVPNYLPEHLNFVQTRHDHGAVCPNLLLFKTFQPDRCEDPAPGLCGKCFSEKPNKIQTWVTEKNCNAWRMESRRALSTSKSIFVSQRLLDLTLKVLNAQALPKARVVHNFIDTTAIDSAAKESLQSEIHASAKVFLASAIYPPKGIGTFLKAYREGGYQYEVEIGGNGAELAELKAMYNLKTINFLGWLPHEKVIERLLSSKVFAVPSLCEESCSTTVLEALYLGRPVAALRRGGTPELKPYESYDGQLSIYDSMEAMADALGYIHPAPMIERNGAFEGSVKSKLQQILDVYSA